MISIWSERAKKSLHIVENYILREFGEDKRSEFIAKKPINGNPIQRVTVFAYNIRTHAFHQRFAITRRFRQEMVQI